MLTDKFGFYLFVCPEQPIWLGDNLM